MTSAISCWASWLSFATCAESTATRSAAAAAALMTDDERDKLLGFLAELRDLCGKYGYEIGGCGCCGSPWLNTSNDGPTKTVDLYADGGEASVAELRDLCGKYGYEIGGCGCCGSPWLNTSNDGPTKTVDLYADGGEASVWIDGEGEVTTNER